MALRKLGWKEAPIHLCANLADALALLAAEEAENVCRKALTIEEGVIIGHKRAEMFKPQAEKAKKDGASKGGKTAGRGRQKKEGELPCGKLPQGKSQGQSSPDTRKTRTQAAAAGGMKPRTFAKAETVIAAAAAEPEKFRPLVDEMNRTGKADGAFKKLKNIKASEQIRAEAPPLPEGPFRIIVVDPPWKYDNREEDATHRAANPYPSMTIEEITALGVRGLAHEDAVLWLWTTNAHIRHAFSILDAWGFTQKTILTWVKDRMGTGDWLRGRTEHCLLGVRGKPVIQLTNQTTAISGPLREHSRKPEEFYALVDALCPGSKVELFARRRREGWASHGNEV